MLSSNRNHTPSLVAGISIALVLLSTVFRGGNRYIPLTILEWMGLVAILAWGWQTLFSNSASVHSPLGTGIRRWAVVALFTFPAWAALIQLMPMPNDGGWQALSTVPQATWASALAGIPIAALFLSALVFDARSLNWLVRTWVAVAVFQGILGLLQLAGVEVLNFGGVPAKVVTGTFANRNHFASLLAMAIPLAMLSLKGPRRETRGSGTVSWPTVAMLFILVAALFASLSRAGLVIGLMAGIATGWVLWRPTQGTNQRGGKWMWALIPLLAVLTLAVGGLDWLSRFDVSQLEVSAREREINRLSTWAAAVDRWPMGSGMGTFSSAIPQHQAPEIILFVNHAHNEYLEWMLELGVLFPAMTVLVLFLVAQRMIHWPQTAHTPVQERLALASTVGLMAALLHAGVDFPLRIPANAMFTAFLLGVLLREPTQKATGAPSSTQELWQQREPK